MIVKFKNNNIEFEIEGNIDEVKEIYSLFKGIFPKNESTNCQINTDTLEVDTIEKGSIQKRKNRQSSQKNSAKPKIINLNIENEREFIEEFKSYTLAKSTTQKIYVLVYLYKKHTGIDVVTVDIVNSLLNFAQLDAPAHLKQLLINFVNQKKTFNKVDDGSFKMKFQTEDYVKGLLQK